jgi:hypothetical protein
LGEYESRSVWSLVCHLNQQEVVVVTRKPSPGKSGKSRSRGKLSVKKETLKDLKARGSVKGGFIMQDTRIVPTTGPMCR